MVTEKYKETSNHFEIAVMHQSALVTISPNILAECMYNKVFSSLWYRCNATSHLHASVSGTPHKCVRWYSLEAALALASSTTRYSRV